MFACGDLVVYGIHGVCRVEDIEERYIDGKQISYFVLMPTDQSCAKFYVPRHNAVAVSKLRPLLKKDELEALLQSEDVKQNAWITDETRRKQYYKEVIASGDRAALLRMVHTLHKQKQLQVAAGRKFHLCDENFLRDAERMLASEFSLVLGIPQSAVADYIKTRLRI